MAEKEIEHRLTKVEDEMTKLQEGLQEVGKSINSCLLGCELPSYKKEMKERCEKLNSQIKFNTDLQRTEKQNLLEKISTLSEEFDYKFKQSRQLMGRIISSCVVFGVALIGVFGTIQVNKVSQQEYNNHLNTYRVDRQEQVDRFNDFINTYTVDREKRDEKIDQMFQKQIDFNQEIVKQNGILQQQLEVLKTKMSLGK